MTVSQQLHKRARSSEEAPLPRLTDADLLSIEGLAAVVGRPGEVERRGVGGARPGAHQDEGELTQHT